MVLVLILIKCSNFRDGRVRDEPGITSVLHLEQTCQQSAESTGMVSFPKGSAMRGLKEEKDLGSGLLIQAERSSREEHGAERNISTWAWRGSAEQKAKRLSESRASLPERVLSIFLPPPTSNHKASHFFGATLKWVLNFRPEAQMEIATPHFLQR